MPRPSVACACGTIIRLPARRCRACEDRARVGQPQPRRHPHALKTHADRLRRRRELYLWRKLCGFCVGCRRWIGPDAPAVYCMRCTRNQTNAHRAQRHRARQKAS